MPPFFEHVYDYENTIVAKIWCLARLLPLF